MVGKNIATTGVLLKNAETVAKGMASFIKLFCKTMGCLLLLKIAAQNLSSNPVDLTALATRNRAPIVITEVDANPPKAISGIKK